MTFFTKQKNIFIAVIFFCTLIIYGFSLPSALMGHPHFSYSDFSNHAHIMYRFAESFKSGQLIPRTVISAFNFPDMTEGAFDNPTFQYYGFFEGLIALPFLLLGLSSSLSAILSTILIRFLGLYLLFEICLLLEASYLSAFLASFSLLISPYTLTDFYGRGDLAEIFAQSLLVLIPYGYVLAYKGRTRAAIISLTCAFFSLALCHNIFFLYGLVLLAVFAIFNPRYKLLLPLTIGTGLGILLSAWQWFPAHQTINETIFANLNKWSLGIELNTLANLSGVLGIPTLYYVPGTYLYYLYLTIGWWTLPFVLLMLKKIFTGENRYLAFIFFITSICFFLMTFEPFNKFIFPFVPTIFGILQFTYRLISFLSLLGAICLAIVIPHVPIRLFTLLLILMVLSQLPVLITYFNLVDQQSVSETEVQESPINYYYSNAKNFLFFKKNNGKLYDENVFYVAPTHHHFFVRLKGVVENDPLQIAILSLQKNALTEKFTVQSLVSKPVTIHSFFNILLNASIKNPSGWYRIVFLANKFASPLNQQNNLNAKVVFTRVDIVAEDIANCIFADNLRSEHLSAYTRRFWIKPEALSQFKRDKEGFYTLGLPMAYSKLFTIAQHGNELMPILDPNHSLLIRTKDSYYPIDVSYHWDKISILLTLLGLTGFSIVLLKRDLFINE